MKSLLLPFFLGNWNAIIGRGSGGIVIVRVTVGIVKPISALRECR